MHAWAHYLGSALASAVHAKLGDQGWFEPYDYDAIEGMPRLLREIDGVQPAPATRMPSRACCTTWASGSAPRCSVRPSPGSARIATASRSTPCVSTASPTCATRAAGARRASLRALERFRKTFRLTGRDGTEGVKEVHPVRSPSDLARARAHW
jgi:hypothetical protein